MHYPAADFKTFTMADCLNRSKTKSCHTNSQPPIKNVIQIVYRLDHLLDLHVHITMALMSSLDVSCYTFYFTYTFITV